MAFGRSVASQVETEQFTQRLISWLRHCGTRPTLQIEFSVNWNYLLARPELFSQQHSVGAAKNGE